MLWRKLQCNNVVVSKLYCFFNSRHRFSGSAPAKLQDRSCGPLQRYSSLNEENLDWKPSDLTVVVL